MRITDFLNLEIPDYLNLEFDGDFIYLYDNRYMSKEDGYMWGYMPTEEELNEAIEHLKSQQVIIDGDFVYVNGFKICWQKS